MSTGPFAFEVTFAPRLAVVGVRVVGFRERSGEVFRERILPRPSCGIILDCTSGSLHSVGAQGRDRAPSGLVGGLAPHAALVQGPAVDCLENQLSPPVAGALLDVRATELNDPFISLDDHRSTAVSVVDRYARAVEHPVSRWCKTGMEARMGCRGLPQYVASRGSSGTVGCAVMTVATMSNSPPRSRR